ncbi:MAG: hypothetical protein WBD27_05310 [Pyrinomonadaceae bacterium]
MRLPETCSDSILLLQKPSNSLLTIIAHPGGCVDGIASPLGERFEGLSYSPSGKAVLFRQLPPKLLAATPPLLKAA